MQFSAYIALVVLSFFLLGCAKRSSIDTAIHISHVSGKCICDKSSGNISLNVELILVSPNKDYTFACESPDSYIIYSPALEPLHYDEPAIGMPAIYTKWIAKHTVTNSAQKYHIVLSDIGEFVTYRLKQKENKFIVLSMKIIESIARSNSVSISIPVTTLR